MTLGEKLKLIRERHDISQNELSRRSGVRQALISELEAGIKDDTTGKSLRKMARVLGVSVDYLLGTFDPDSEPMAADAA
jgi:transcriptional regulator with XRE-family HTH domain